MARLMCDGAVAMQEALYFLEKADRCFALSRMAGDNSQLRTELENMAHEFMAKAVEADTERDKAAKKSR